MKTKTCYETHHNCNGSSCNHEKAAHTPGPWSFEAGSEYTVRGSNKQIVFLIGDNRRAIPMGPDALLICAAPDYDYAAKRLLAAFEALPESTRNELPNEFVNSMGLLHDAAAKTGN